MALGALLGFGIGVGALFGLEGLAGAGLCMLVLGLCFFAAKDAEPVLVGVESEPEGETEKIPDDVVPELELDPLIEPLEMLEIPGGTFLMGSNDYDNEKPQHKVTVSDFCISRYLITRQLYREIVEGSPEEWANDKDDQQLPANHVTWFDAVKICNALSEQVGLQACYRIDGKQVEWDREADGYRLPTEAEWEFACRAGTTSQWFFGDDPAELGRYAWFRDNSEKKAHPVGEKEPNPLGLHDMIGNVWEWCWDWYGDYKEDSDAKDMDRWPRSVRFYYAIGHIILKIPVIGQLLVKDSSDSSLHDPIGPKEGDARVLRGGSFGSEAGRLRSALRDRIQPEFRSEYIGFRCVRRPRRQP